MILLMEVLQWQNSLFQSVLISIPLSLSNVSSRKPGDIWVHIGMHTIMLLHMHHSDNATSRKKLNAYQAAFANKQYKSYQRVGLPNDIIRSLTSKDEQKTL